MIRDLCRGNEKQNIPKCLNSDVRIEQFERPLFARSYNTVIVHRSSVYCSAQYGKPILKLTSKCALFNNQTLIDSLKVVKK